GRAETKTADIKTADIKTAGIKTANIEVVTDTAQMEDFLHAYVAGRGFSEKDHERLKANPWLGLPGWSLYLARLDGRPAAAGILFRHGDVAYLADACTDPVF